MKTYNVQLVLVVVVVAASLFVISPVAADGIRKSFFVEKNGYYEPPTTGPGRTQTCSKNATICLDAKLNPAGPTCCASKCVNIKIDTFNCGGCSRPCSKGWTCCAGVCVYTPSDSLNCGLCGKVCTKNKKGKIGKCRYGICEYNGYY